ncbi:tetratricopeptide repeat protein [Stieleria marina]
MSQSRFAEAEPLIRQELEKDIADAGLLCLLSISLSRQNKTKGAMEAAREAVRLEPESDQAHFALALALSERKDLRGALASAKEALRLDPDDVQNYALNAQILTEMMKHSAAIKMAEQGLQIDPENETCRFYRSVLLGRQGRQLEADEQSLELLADEPDDETSHCARGWVLIHSGDGLGAEQHFIEALRIDPNHEDARDGLAEALKIQNPLVGLIYKGLSLIGRTSIWAVVIGVIVAGQVARFLRSQDDPAIQMTGVILNVVFYLFLTLILIAPALADLTLFASSRGRLAMTALQKHGVRWWIVPLLIGCGHFLWWSVFGGRLGPLQSMGWCAIAALIHETYQYPQSWVRKRMLGVATVLLVTMLVTEYSNAVILRPMRIEMIPDSLLSNAKTIPAKETIADLQTRLETYIKTRSYLVVYPALAVLLIGCLRDNIADWFVRRSPDAE